MEALALLCLWAQFPRPKFAWAKGAGKSQQADSDWPTLPPAGQQRNWVSQSAKPARKVFGALNQVWNFIPEEAQKAIAGAGFKVQTDLIAPSPGNGKGNGKPSQPAKGDKGPGKGKGYPPAKELTPAQAEIAKGLFESATDEQKDVLKLMGVEQPTQPTPDLMELCRQRIDALPESIKLLLEKQSEPEKAPTVTETSRKFQGCYCGFERAHPQEKHSSAEDQRKTKTAYTDLLVEMQQLQETLTKQQQGRTVFRRSSPLLVPAFCRPFRS